MEKQSRRFDDLEQKIRSGDYHAEATAVKEWGGADVIIVRQRTEEVDQWLESAPLVVSAQESEPRRRAVVTDCSRELSWLFYELSDVLRDSLDYVSKYDIFGQLADTAMDYLEQTAEPQCDSLLLAVLDKARGLARGNADLIDRSEGA